MAILIYLSTYQFLIFVVTTNIFNIWQKISIFYSSLGVFTINFTATSRIMALLVSVFTAINISMLVFYLRRRIKRQRDWGVGFVGIIFGIVGVGCISCGSVLLSTFIGFSSSIILLKFLPLKGVEFSLIGIFLILLSIYLLSKKIINPEVCRINNKFVV